MEIKGMITLILFLIRYSQLNYLDSLNAEPTSIGWTGFNLLYFNICTVL
jgi:hypothetical protein